MGQGRVRQNGQDHGHGDPVVSAQRGILGPDPLTVGHQVQSLHRHILGAVLRLGADHVHVALQDDGSSPLIARRGLLPDDQVVGIVLPVLQAQLPGKARTQVADRLDVAAAVRHGAQLFKIGRAHV